MQLHFLMVGFIAKTIHIDSALRVGAKLSLLMARDKYKDEYAKLFHHVLVVDDIYNWQELKKAIDSVEKIDAVLTRQENFVSVVGAINEYLGLRGIDYQSSRNFCNKYLMKRRWLNAGVPCADGICLNNLDQLDEFLAKHSFPMILKKTSAAHSNFVIKVKSKGDLLAKLDFLQKKVASHVLSKPIGGYADASDECQFLLEEMMRGRELTVDTFVSQGQLVHTPICEYTMAHELDVDDSYLPIRTIPATLSKAQKELVLEVTNQALHALKASNCVCHTELFLDEQSGICRVIETTPRGGGNRTEMVAMSTGYDYGLAVFQAAADLAVPAVARPARAVSVVEFFADGKGTIQAIDVDFLRHNPSVSHIKINRQPGDMVDQAKFGGKLIVSFFVEASNEKTSQKLARALFQELRSKIKIDYE